MGESHQQLLLSLKTIVEGLLSSQVANVWNIYGGLNRLHGILEKIFKHEFSIFKQDGEEDCWVFIQGLNWLRPNLASSPTPICISSSPPHPHTDQAMIWLYNSLETHSLSEKLSWLVSDEQHLASCYNPNAFLRQPQYAEAALICLRAIEQNQLSFLTDIHPSLYLSRRNLKAQEKVHRRCSSFPDGFRPNMWAQKSQQNTNPSTELSTIIQKSKYSYSSTITESSLTGKDGIESKNKSRENQKFYRERPWKSLPCLLAPNFRDKTLSKSEPLSVPLSRKCECKTEPSSPAVCNKMNVRAEFPFVGAPTKLSPSVLKINYKTESKESSGSIKMCSRRLLKGKNSNRSSNFMPGTNSSGESVEMSNKAPRSSKFHRKGVNRLPTVNQQESTDTEVESRHSFTSPRSHLDSSFGSHENSILKIGKAKSFIEDGGCHVQPMSTGFFPRPIEGQSLASFLSSSQFSQANAELDRENAHFSISEAIIATIEQVKCSRWENLPDDIIEESDEELRQRIEQRIRLRRRQKQEAKHHTMWIMPLSDTTTTDQSISPLSSPSSGSTDSLSTEGVEDMEVDKVTPSNLKEIYDAGLSLSMASLYSEADLGIPRPVPASTPDYMSSAESVALSLLKKFSDKQLPKASDIKWLVSEKEAPQELLPMPKVWVMSADDAEEQDMRNATALRGTTQWAPPRRQIIFTTHPPPQRKLLMLKQQFRCAGCGMKVEPKYAHRFRYCEYLGRYFCTGCHRNKPALIPAKILSKWDFSKYPVSDFSSSLLEHIMTDPLFSITYINPILYKQIKALERTRKLRLQLCYIKDFLLMCRFADEAKEALKQEQYHLLVDSETYSMQDLIQVKSGELIQRLQKLFVLATTHVAQCELCQARGFVCEICHSDDIIYPWQLCKVSRCSKCGSCYHATCLKPHISCRRCDRISARKTSSLSENT